MPKGSNNNAASWPAAKIEMWNLERIIPYDKNPRQHSPEQIDLIARSMVDDGVTAPILVDEKGIVIYGHGRRMAAEKNGFAQYPVIVARNWSDQKKRAYRIKDNSYALLSSWAPDLLRGELNQLSADGYEMKLLGFEGTQLVSFMAGVNTGSDPEVAPEPPDNPVTKRGDIWVLGRHRIICGDSTNAEDVAAVLGGENPHLCVTDPPYGVDYDPDWRNRTDRSNGKPYGARAVGLVSNDHRSDWRDAWKLFPGDVIYCWHPPGANSVEFYHGLDDSGFPIRMQIIWNKSNFPIGRGDYHVKHEPCWYAVRKGKKGHWAGDRKQTTVWDIPKPQKSETGHSTQKPIECMRRPIENNSKPGDAVYEPFSGSGTTIMAAEMTGRRCFAVELSPQYVDVTIKRWEAFTGKEATLEGDGRTFPAVAKSRKPPASSKRKKATA